MTVAAASRDARIPFLECYGEPSDGERLGKDHTMLGPFFRAAIRLARRRTHHKLARRHHHHRGTMVALLEAIVRAKRALLPGRERFRLTGLGRRAKNCEDKKQ